MVRIGHGYDVHRLVKGRKLILGGVEIPFVKGLAGHSDADVVIHALMDAMLGAAALGDIGCFFPDNDERFLNSNSIKLLKDINDVIKSKGFVLGNADITVIAQEPKLLTFIKPMRENISNTINSSVEKISIKATTEEYLGFTGKGLGIAAHAVVLLEQLSGENL